MDILAWLLVAFGVFICYSAFKGHAPWETFKSAVTTSPTGQTGGK